MSRISYPQLVKNIADAYRDATGTTEAIAISELVQKVADAMENGGGESVSYMSIIYNEDDSLTMIDSDGTEHTMTLTYDDEGKVVETTLDGKSSKITYDDDGNLTSINKTELDMSKVPKGAVSVPTTVTAESGVAEVILPVNAEPVTVEINSSSFSVNTIVALESEE